MEGSSLTPGARKDSGRPDGEPASGVRPRVVFHVDMDAFYAAVEARDDPSLSHVPLVVGADPRGGKGRGVVCTANYPARAYGIRSAMPIAKAWQLAPHAVYVQPDFGKYSEASDRVMEVLGEYAAQPGHDGECGVLEVVGMDEAYLDLTALATVEGPDGPAVDWPLVSSIARSLQAAVKRATGLSCSVGAAPSKSVAKVASDRHKPHGVTRVRPDEVAAFLEPLPVRSIPGCGPKTSALLTEEGLPTVGDLVRAGRIELTRLLGHHGEWLHAVATGHDPRAVVADRGDCKSRSNERTFLEDARDMAHVRGVAQRLLGGLLEDMQRDGRAFATLTAKVRYTDFTTLTRSQTVEVPLEPGNPATPDLAARALDRLLDPVLDGRRVRLIGVRVAGFQPPAGQRALTSYGLDPGLMSPVKQRPTHAGLGPALVGVAVSSKALAASSAVDGAPGDRVPGALPAGAPMRWHQAGLGPALAPGLRKAFHPGLQDGLAVAA